MFVQYALSGLTFVIRTTLVARFVAGFIVHKSRCPSPNSAAEVILPWPGP
jgi:hypothetical protein